MKIFKVEPGQTVNGRIILEFAGPSSNSRNRRVLVRCSDCGKDSVLRLDSVLFHSCPCVTHLIKGDSVAKKKLLRTYKRWSTKARNTSFELTDDEFFDLTQQNCYYCGDPPSNTCWPDTGNRTSDRAYTYNGIDRLDNKKGYTKDNSVPCCTDCNFMKGPMAANDFITKALSIANHLKASGLS